MSRSKATSFKFSVEFSERDNNLLEDLAARYGVSKREILRQGLLVFAELAKAKAAGEKFLVENGEERRELLLLFAI